jgi:AcrR family transcriptional regulator
VGVLTIPRGPRDSKATRERLLRAALELFTADGFLGTTTPALAARAGIAEGTIYRHFPSKEVLLNEVFRESQRWLIGLLREVETDRTQTTQGKLARLAQRLIVAAGEDPARVRMALLPRDVRFLDGPSREVAREFREALQHLVATGKSDGLVRSGPADLWGAVWLALVSFATERVSTGEWTPEHPQAAQTVEVAWEAIAARNTSARVDSPSASPT